MTQNHRFSMKDLPIDERPREKLIKSGPENLSNAELIAIILRTGARNRTALRLAQEILIYFEGLHGFFDASFEELMQMPGIGQVKATQLLAFTELAKRIFTAFNQRKRIRSAQDIARILMPEMRFLKKEVFRVILLNNQNELLAISEISKGSISETIVHPREVFLEAVRRSSSALIIAHNHPGGNPEPSVDDLNITRRLARAGQILGIQLLDHLIIGNGCFVSLKERALI